MGNYYPTTPSGSSDVAICKSGENSPFRAAEPDSAQSGSREGGVASWMLYPQQCAPQQLDAPGLLVVL